MTKKQLEKEINSLYGKYFHGIPIYMLDIPEIWNAIKEALHLDSIAQDETMKLIVSKYRH